MLKISKLIEVLLPYTCILCNSLSDQRIDLCSYYFNNLPFYPTSCIKCGKPITKIASQCGQCLKSPPQFNNTHILFQYKPPITKLLKRLKFNQNLTNAKVLGELLAKYVAIKYANLKFPNVLLPIPLHPKRIKQRGFNQTIELARPIAKLLKIPIEYKFCHRVRETLPQTMLPAHARRKNLQNAFYINANLTGMHIAVIEDVITTGSTIKSFCQALKQAGAHKIDIWCIARGSVGLEYV